MLIKTLNISEYSVSYPNKTEPASLRKGPYDHWLKFTNKVQFKRYHSDKHFSRVFTYKMAAKLTGIDGTIIMSLSPYVC